MSRSSTKVLGVDPERSSSSDAQLHQPYPLEHIPSSRSTHVIADEAAALPQTLPTQINPLSRYGRPLRPNQRYLYAFTDDDVQAYRSNLQQLLKIDSRKDNILKSIFEEIDNLMSPGIMESVPWTSIAPSHRREVIRLWLFHKEKVDSKGKFLKDKCRIVTLSQSRDTASVGLTYSPTVNPISFFVLMAFAATKPEYKLAAYDIKGAFLNSRIDDDTYVYVKAENELAQWFIKRYAHLQSRLNKDGSLTFRLRRYLYGLQESPLAWNRTLNEKLVS
jgi:hypothetical protein